MPTMKDVARAAGVSLGTVSNVINRPGIVRFEKREQVYRAIEKLDYRSNLVAKALKTKTSKSIGLILPDIGNPYYPAIARGVEDAAQREGLTVFLCNSDRNLAKEQAYLDALLKKGVDGLILVKPQISCEEVNGLCQRCRVVLVDLAFDAALDQACSLLNVDDQVGIVAVMELLYGYGHRKIAFISGLLESKSSQTCYNLYIKFLKDHALPMEACYIAKGDYRWTSGYRETQRMMRLPEPPTAIFAANDLMAIGAEKAVRESGRQIPEEVSVFGYDDIDMAQLCTPPLTTLHLPKYELGVTSVELLAEGFCTAEKEAKVPGRQLTLKTEIILRESVGPAPSTATKEP